LLPVQFFSAQERSRQAVAIEGPYWIGYRVQDAIDFSIFFALYQRRQTGENFRALVLDATGGTAATRTGHITPDARGLAAGARCRPHAKQPLSQQALLFIDKQILWPLEFRNG
jgi:hypothetical protein